MAVKLFDGTIDAFCPDCKAPSVFRRVLPQDLLVLRSTIGLHLQLSKAYKPEEEYFHVQLICTRIHSHSLDFWFKHKNFRLEKVGQSPSIASLGAQDVIKYKSILGSTKFREFNRAIGLSSHGVGVGAFVYLRRIFEGLIEEAHKTAEAEKTLDESAYKKSRMVEKISLLKDYLPAFLVEHASLYAIMSKGIHELTEEDCLEHFPVLRTGIEIILDEKLTTKERLEKIEAAKKAISLSTAKLAK